jgi:hypothetical protein
MRIEGVVGVGVGGLDRRIGRCVGNKETKDFTHDVEFELVGRRLAKLVKKVVMNGLVLQFHRPVGLRLGDGDRRPTTILVEDDFVEKVDKLVKRDDIVNGLE